VALNWETVWAWFGFLPAILIGCVFDSDGRAASWESRGIGQQKTMHYW
jgi:hypothetical protein